MKNSDSVLSISNVVLFGTLLSNSCFLCACKLFIAYTVRN